MPERDDRGPILVTGGTGFVGRHLLRSLTQAGRDVHAVVRSRSPRPIPPDVRAHVVDDSVAEVGGVVDALRPRAVVHLATLFVAEHQPHQVRDLIDTNVALGTVVAEACTRAGARLVNVTSAWQHFEGREYSPVSLYAATKQAYADIVQYYAEVRGLVAAEVCLFDTYGPQDERRKLVWALLEHALSGAPLEMSSGEQLIDLTHVSDVVRGLMLAVDGAADGGRLVLRSGEPRRVRELVDLVARVTGRTLDVRWGVRANRPREMYVDWQIDGVAAGWRPHVSLEAGLGELWDERLSVSPTPSTAPGPRPTAR